MPRQKYQNNYQVTSLLETRPPITELARTAAAAFIRKLDGHCQKSDEHEKKGTISVKADRSSEATHLHVKNGT
jgi:hypothetical protein